MDAEWNISFNTQESMKIECCTQVQKAVQKAAKIIAPVVFSQDTQIIMATGALNKAIWLFTFFSERITLQTCAHECSLPICFIPLYRS